MSEPAMNRSAPSASHPVPEPVGAGDGQSGGARFAYQLQPTAPPLDPAEVDAAQQTVEVVVMWGELSILHVAHMPPQRGFSVGDDGEADFLIGRESIGAGRLPVTVGSGDGAAVVVPPGASGEVTVDGQQRTFEQLADAGHMQPCVELPGAMQYALPAGATARVHHRGFTFIVRPMSAARPLGVGGATIDWRSHVWTGASVLFHVAVLVAFYFLPPSGTGLSLDLLNADSRLVHFATQAQSVDMEEPPDWLPEPEATKEGGTGERHEGDEGQAGDEQAAKTDSHYGVKGPQDNVEPVLAKEMSAQEIADNSIIGVLQRAVVAFNQPTSPYGAEQARGSDPMNALGAIMGNQVGANFGFGGIGMRGTGAGGGGNGVGTIGVGDVGTIGHGSGPGKGKGYGSGAGGPMHIRDAKVPRIRTAPAVVRGSLSKEVIRRTIRRHLNEVRYCYEQSLVQRPDLSGRVAVKFIIAPTGAVRMAVVDKSTVGEQRVGQCIATAVQRWSFPAPDGGGLVVVTYPFVLEQAGG